MKTTIKQIVGRLESLQLDKQKMILVAIAAAVIVYIDCAYLLQFQYKNLTGLSKKVVGLDKDLRIFKKEYANLATYKNTQSQLQVKGKRLVTQDQKQAFVEYLYDVAHKSQVKILQWKPDTDNKVKEETVNRIKLTPYSMTMDLLCGYHELGTFINALENGTFYAAVTDIKINAGGADSIQQAVVLILKIYAKK